MTGEPKSRPRARPTRFKQQVVEDRGFKDIRLLDEEVAEMPYRPVACQHTYRLVIYTTTYSPRNETLSVVNPADKRTTYAYDTVQGRRATLMNPDSGLTTYAYDGKGRLRTQVNPQNQMTTFSYDAADRKTRMDLGNGLFTTYQYDAAARLIEANDYYDASAYNQVFESELAALRQRISDLTISAKLDNLKDMDWAGSGFLLVFS